MRRVAAGRIPFFVLALAGVSARAGPGDARGPLVEPDPQATVCQPPETLAGEVVLESSCIYEANLRIEQSGTTLDCNGAWVRPARGRAIWIAGQLEDVTVTDCYLGGGGVRVQGPPREPGESDDALRARSPRNVVIEHIHVKESHMTGIFIGPHVTGVTVRKSIVEHTASSGIYLEYGTRDNRIEDNLIQDNGHTLGDGTPRVNWWRREGIAVDASAHNTITGNTLRRNAFGGIFLYKNCWELHSYEPDSEQRVQHARDNLIEGNQFSDMPVGVWVASRQARDLGAWDCGDPTPYPNPIPLEEAFPDEPACRGTIPAPYDYSAEYLWAKFEGRTCPQDDCSTDRDAVWIWPDFAEDNTIRGNTFSRLELIGVRVEDDGTTIEGNLFLGDFDYVYLGTPFRARYLGEPVLGTRITDNLFQSPEAEGFEERLCLVEGEHQDTMVAHNAPACRGGDGQWEACSPPRGGQSGCGHTGGTAGLAGLWGGLLWLAGARRRRPAGRG